MRNYTVGLAVHACDVAGTHAGYLRTHGRGYEGALKMLGAHRDTPSMVQPEGCTMRYG
jgi:hypothetical protein